MLSRLALLFSMTLLSSTAARADVLRVEQDGSGDFLSINTAMTAAEDGDVIQVGAGVFEESLTITKFLALLGKGPGETIIRPEAGAPAISINQGVGDAFAILIGFSVDGGAPAIQAEGICDGVDNLFVGDVHLEYPETSGIAVQACGSETDFGMQLVRVVVVGAPDAAVTFDAPEADHLRSGLMVVASRFEDCGAGVVADVDTVETFALGGGEETFLGVISNSTFTDIAGQPIDLDITAYYNGDYRPAMGILQNQILDSGGGVHLRCASSVSTWPLTSCYAQVANNVIDHVEGPGIWLETGPRGATDGLSFLINNTVVKGQGSETGDGIRLTSGSDLALGGKILNNILYDNDGYAFRTEGENHTSWWYYNNTTYNLADWYGTYEGFLADPQHADPQFVVYGATGPGLDDDLHLGPTSPCIDAGYDDADFNDPDGSRGDMGAFGGPFAPTGGAVDDDGDGYNELEGDCDDADPHSFPGGAEVPNDGLDQDCDGYDVADADGDSFRAGVSDLVAHLEGSGAVTGHVPLVELMDEFETGSSSIVEAWVRFERDTGEDQVVIQLAGAAVTPTGDPAPSLSIRYRHDEASIGLTYSQTHVGDDTELVFIGVPFEMTANLGIWHHLAAVLQTTATDFNILQFYLDGRLEAAQFTPGTLSSWVGAVNVGAAERHDGSWSLGLWGDIDDARVRSESELAGDFDLPGRPVGHSDCQLLWTFDSGAIADAGCNQVYGTPVGEIQLRSREMDCDDEQAAIHPGAEEVCDLLDDDCDGHVPADEIDADGDGFGICHGDCDDDRANAHPDHPEVCDGLDNDCDGFEDNDLDTDMDGDGHLTADSCASPADDCDDNDPTVFPGTQELCDDGIDNDCDGAADLDDNACEGWEPPIGDDEYVGYSCACDAGVQEGRASGVALFALALLHTRRRKLGLQ